MNEEDYYVEAEWIWLHVFSIEATFPCKEVKLEDGEGYGSKYLIKAEVEELIAVLQTIHDRMIY